MREVNDNHSPVARERRGVAPTGACSQIVDQEPGTTWFAIRLIPITRSCIRSGLIPAAHLSGKVAAALMAQAPDLLADPPVIEKSRFLRSKLRPHWPKRERNNDFTAVIPMINA